MSEDMRTYPTGCERHTKDIARIAELEEAVRVLAILLHWKERAWSLDQLGMVMEPRTMNRAKAAENAVYANPIAREAIEKAKEGQ